MFKRKKWLVKNEATGLYAGNGWVEKKDARRFKKESDASLVATILALTTCDYCCAVHEDKS